MKKAELQKNIDWEIRTEKLSLGNSYDTGKKAVIRNDNNQLLGIVGQNYCPVSNYQLMQFTQALTKSGEFVLEGFDEMNEGKHIIAFLKNTNPNLKLNGCASEEYMLLANSHDGSKCFQIGTASNLIRCSNQFTAMLKVFSKKHTSYLDIDDLNIRGIISSYKIKKSSVYEAFDGMESVKVDQSVINKLIKEVHVMLATDSSVAKQKDWAHSPSMLTLQKSIEREMKDLGNNAFGLFNGVTWYTTHEMRTNNSEQSRINGTAALINQKAYRFCTNLKRNNL